MRNKLMIILGLISYLVGISACDSLGSTSISTSNSTPPKSVTLSWGAATGTITGYSVEQSTDNVTFTQVLTVANVTSATVSGLIVGKTYYFQVKAYNAGGKSSASPVAAIAVQ